VRGGGGLAGRARAREEITFLLGPMGALPKTGCTEEFVIGMADCVGWSSSRRPSFSSSPPPRPQRSLNCRTRAWPRGGRSRFLPLSSRRPASTAIRKGREKGTIQGLKMSRMSERRTEISF